MLQILMSETTHKDHVFNRFVWGNKKSLNGHTEELWTDLKHFFDNQYSADRMKLVIAVKSNDDLKELKAWVEESFSIIENKNLGTGAILP